VSVMPAAQHRGEIQLSLRPGDDAARISLPVGQLAGPRNRRVLRLAQLQLVVNHRDFPSGCAAC
jgi:hypothetical protein